MNIEKLMQDDRFHIVFSILLGLGIVCIVHPMCTGKDCGIIAKPPSDKDFDKYVYQMGKKCYAFKTEVVECPASGAIEAFVEGPKRRTPIVRA